MTYRVERLSADHILDDFACGNAELDTWLKEHAIRAAGQGTRTYLLIAKRGDKVSGYFAIAPHLVARDELSRSIGRGAPQRVPAILLAKLALNQTVQGQRLGGELLVSALRTIVTAARSAGGRLIAVDAIDDNAAGFYAAHDFQPAPNNPLRFVMKLSTAARALGEPWP